jgi:hypothetical protein
MPYFHMHVALSPLAILAGCAPIDTGNDKDGRSMGYTPLMQGRGTKSVTLIAFPDKNEFMLCRLVPVHPWVDTGHIPCHQIDFEWIESPG